MKVRTLNQSLFDDYTAGKITLHEAAREFHSHGWTNYVDEDFTLRTFNQLKK